MIYQRVRVLKRIELEEYIKSNYNADVDYPWKKYPDYTVFRHSNNKKWFALIMSVKKSKLGLQGNDLLNIVNFKCDPIMIGSLLTNSGFFPAYHMNKTNWITVALDDSILDETMKMLLQISYDKTI